MSAAATVSTRKARRFLARSDGEVTDAMRASYARDGFLILEGFASAAECAALRRRAEELVEAFDPDGPRTVFSTGDQSHARELYFLESGGAIRGFLEAEAIDAEGRLTVDKAAGLNKLGHALHDLDPVFDRFSRQPRMAALSTALGLKRPLLLQSMYIFKHPLIGGEVDWHQDASFLITEPQSVIGFWLALDEATLANGCLLALPGAHEGPLRRRFVRQGTRTRMELLDPTPWPATQPQALEVPSGSLVVLHGLLPHASAANRSSRSRHAYSLHVIDGTATYAAENWLQRRDLPLRGFT